MPKHFCTLGMFIIDEFEYRDLEGRLLSFVRKPKVRNLLTAAVFSQIGGGGTYAALGARIFLNASQIGMIVDKGIDFPDDILRELLSFGEEMWFFRRRTGENTGTTRALNKYIGQRRGFEYLTPRIRVTPKDLQRSFGFSRPTQLHFICSPSRAEEIVAEINEIGDWTPFTIYEPIPDSCVPKELPTLLKVLPTISLLSPNSDEAFSLLSMTGPPTRESIQRACDRFLEIGVGEHGQGHVIIRSGPLGAYVGSRGKQGKWIDAFWRQNDQEKIVDVTGAGNAFLGGLSAGLWLSDDVNEAALYGTISASFAIEQYGLPCQTEGGTWNRDDPLARLRILRARMATS